MRSLAAKALWSLAVAGIVVMLSNNLFKEAEDVEIAQD